MSATTLGFVEVARLLSSLIELLDRDRGALEAVRQDRDRVAAECEEARIEAVRLAERVEAERARYEAVALVERIRAELEALRAEPQRRRR